MNNGHRHDKTSIYYTRLLHRYIGCITLGLTLVYALSGVVLIYRDTEFLKTPVHVEQTIDQKLAPADLAKNLHLRHFALKKTDGEVLYFQNMPSIREGTYNKATGAVSFTENRFPSIIERLISIHKLGSGNEMHWFSAVYGVMLLFLAVSSLWMFKPGTQKFRRVLLVSGGGMALTVTLLYLV